MPATGEVELIVLVSFSPNGFVDLALTLAYMAAFLRGCLVLQCSRHLSSS